MDPCTPRRKGRPVPRTLAPGQRCRIHVLDVDTGEDRILHESSTVLYEAPNWTLDGRTLILNGDGHLFELAVDGGRPQRLDLGAMAPLNNDHVLDPDGEHVYVSADDGQVHRAPLSGGTATRITEDDGYLHFLHGVSPDGTTLACTGVRRRPDGSWLAPGIVTIPAAGGEATALTDDEFPDDGPEYSPDGSWLYINSERGGTAAGHAQLFRMRPDGTGREQLTHDERVNWFPHPSPDGGRLAYVSFPPGTQGHPADREVLLRLCAADGSEARDLVRLRGGQGTMNVNSWAPDSRRLAYVDYPWTE
ncbi:biopolymer transporter Tol [Brachybacterium avium]|uniref:Biopolymer transporter Tol n=1 Tax=Brachybacterium avium TaxID=2017485 RepID=A0A220UDA8_9MICO|nr:biopolymer transporter Tol [Brachybacterium avium]